jgi:predicted RNA-binding protein with PUA-like domain
MIGYWFLKTEPSEYAFEDLCREGKTVWEGVTNNLALRHLRAMRRGDEGVLYHTGKEKAVVGTIRIDSDPYVAPGERNPQVVVVDVRCGKPFARPVPLDVLKGDPVFAGSDLLRIPRLSVVPLSAEQWIRIRSLSA